MWDVLITNMVTIIDTTGRLKVLTTNQSKITYAKV